MSAEQPVLAVDTIVFSKLLEERAKWLEVQKEIERLAMGE